MIRPRGLNQQRYVKEILGNDINFGIGPAGTGKTYLAVACAVDALEREQIRRILLVRPAVEAGENSASCPATWPRRSTRTCARCTTRCTRCSASNTWPS
jgi:phosphate starvation-inducible PhoH-like protein